METFDYDRLEILCGYSNYPEYRLSFIEPTEQEIREHRIALRNEKIKEIAIDVSYFTIMALIFSGQLCILFCAALRFIK